MVTVIHSALPSSTHSFIRSVALGSSLDNILHGWPPLSLFNQHRCFQKEGRRKGQQDVQRFAEDLLWTFNPPSNPMWKASSSPFHKWRDWVPETRGLLSGSHGAQPPWEVWYSGHCACAAGRHLPALLGNYQPWGGKRYVWKSRGHGCRSQWWTLSSFSACGATTGAQTHTR